MSSYQINLSKVRIHHHWRVSEIAKSEGSVRYDLYVIDPKGKFRVILECFDDFVQYFLNTQSGGENTTKHIRKSEGKLLQKKIIVLWPTSNTKHARINVTGNVSTVHEIVNRYYSSRCCNSVDSAFNIQHVCPTA